MDRVLIWDDRASTGDGNGVAVARGAVRPCGRTVVDSRQLVPWRAHNRSIGTTWSRSSAVYDRWPVYMAYSAFEASAECVAKLSEALQVTARHPPSGLDLEGHHVAVLSLDDQIDLVPVSGVPLTDVHRGIEP